ncbi:MAG: C25 family cysteine peptidase [Candidatus Thermoplasmatota archaeon]|nr:C25 family cysteine peptidase [Candidatus Thermoplasmatota archaeon]
MKMKMKKPSISRTTVALFIVFAISFPIFLNSTPSTSVSGDVKEDISLYVDVEYAIITPNPEIQMEFQPLDMWRSKTGVNTHTFGIEEILGSENGDDDAERLFNFISLLYNETDGRLRYVLLAGDADLIPTRYLHAGGSDYGLDDQYISDVYYSAPGFDWDADDDNIYGEREDIESVGIENLSFPIKVGRAPVSNATEAQRFVQRVISYETDPPEGGWTGEGIVASSLMDTPNIINNPATPTDEGFDAYKDNGYKAILNYTLPYIPRSIDLIEAHDYMEYEGGSYSLENDTLSSDTLVNHLNNGSAFFTFAGQSYYDVGYPVNPYLAYSLAQWMAPGDVSMELGFSIALSHRDTWNLTNGGKLPVVYLSSCDSANFSDPSGMDLSNLLYAPNGGAICLIGSTGISWRGEGKDYSLGNWYLMPRFWERFVESHMPGEALYDLKQDYIDSKWDEIATKEPLLASLYTYNYLGDPALRSWLGEPKEMVVTPISEELYAGKDSYEVEVKDGLGTPLLEATVSILSNTRIFKGTTGPDGRVTVPTEFLEGGKAHLTVTAKNFIPYQGNLTILEEPADVRAVPGSISMVPNRPTEGSIMTVSAEFENVGDRDLEDVEISIYSSIFLNMDDILEQDPEATVIISIPENVSENVSFEVTPLRSWSGITIAAMPFDEELIVSDNMISTGVRINARPRFFPIPMMEIPEDLSAGGELELADMVFEPDNDELIFTLLPGSPQWVTLSTEGVLSVLPPLNWSGQFSIELRVSDGLAWDTSTMYIHVVPVNDAPSLIMVESRYEAFVDQPFSVRMETVDAEGEIVSLDLSSDIASLRFVGNNLRFVPYTEDIGMHEIEIRVTDPSGASRNYSILLEVISSTNRLYFTESSIHLPPALEDETYSHTITIDGDLVVGAEFSDDTELFDIDPATGEIAFTPSSEDVGDHFVQITVTNGNHTATRTFLFRVDESIGTPTYVYWLLGAGIVMVLVLMIMIYLWSGRPMAQYGLEE